MGNKEEDKGAEEDVFVEHDQGGLLNKQSSLVTKVDQVVISTHSTSRSGSLRLDIPRFASQVDSGAMSSGASSTSGSHQSDSESEGCSSSFESSTQASVKEDKVTNVNDEEEPHFFEGPEKILEVDFKATGDEDGLGMRKITREAWDRILKLARCEIVSQLSNQDMDSYVLSESSLFVWKHRIFLKTCGTTTLLRCFPQLLKEAAVVGEELVWFCYSRKNFIFPEFQVFPHNSFAEEIEYTKECSAPRGGPLGGGAYVLGDLMGDHWYVYSSDYSNMQPNDRPLTERNVNIMVYGMSPEVCSHFFRQDGAHDDAMRVRKSFAPLCGNSSFDDFVFNPCGYSMNAIDGETFYTVHVTPEPAFSYASFETNLALTDYTELLEKVVAIFKPERFVLTIFGDEGALDEIRHTPKDITGFSRETHSSTFFRDEYACRMEAYKMTDVVR